MELRDASVCLWKKWFCGHLTASVVTGVVCSHVRSKYNKSANLNHISQTEHGEELSAGCGWVVGSNTGVQVILRGS